MGPQGPPGVSERRLSYGYVVNICDDTVTPINGTDGLAEPPISLPNAPTYSIAINANTHHAYIPSYNDSVVDVVDVDANQVIATVPVGPNPSILDVNPNTNRVYVPNTNGNTVSVIDGASNAVIATIPSSLRPHAAAVNAVMNREYVINDGTRDLSVIDGATNVLTRVVSFSASIPWYVAVNPNTNTVYVASTDGIFWVVNAAAGAVVDFFGLPTDYPSGLAVDPKTNLIYVTGNNGIMVTINGNTNGIINTQTLASRISGIAIDPDTNLVYISADLEQAMLLYNRVSNTIVNSIPVRCPTAVATVTKVSVG